MKQCLKYMLVLVLLVAVACGEERREEATLPEFEPFKVAVENEECRVEICYQRIVNIDRNPNFADIEAQNYAHTFDGYVVEPMDIDTSVQMLVDEYTEVGGWNMSHSSLPCWYTMDQRVHFVRNDAILCYETFVESYTGGAHGGNSLWYECFDLATGQLYDLGYLFEGEWGPAMRELIHARLTALEPGTFIESADMLPVANSTLITERGIVIVYQPYAVASFAAGIISLALTDEEIASTGAPLVWVAE